MSHHSEIEAVCKYKESAVFSPQSNFLLFGCVQLALKTFSQNVASAYQYSIFQICLQRFPTQELLQYSMHFWLR